MHKYIEERIISVNNALNKEWKEDFHLTAHRKMTEEEEGVVTLETMGRKMTVFISKEYVFLLIQGLFNGKSFDYQLLNDLNMLSHHSKYTLDEGIINAEHNFYTGQYIINAKPKLLTENIRMFLLEIDKHEKGIEGGLENITLS